MLQTSEVIAFVGSADLRQARAFYEQALAGYCRSWPEVQPPRCRLNQSRAGPLEASKPLV